MIEIPLVDANDFRISIELDGKLYILHMVWNSEGAYWTLSIEDINQNTRLAGVKVVRLSPLLQFFHYLDVPPGEFVVFGECGRMSFVEDRGRLTYVTEAEIASL